MYSRGEASRIKQEFWTKFGQYISVHQSITGDRVNWVNYKTGIRHVYFRMHADKKIALISIDICHPDEGIQELYYEQFLEYKEILHQAVGEEWIWDPGVEDENYKIISRIYMQIDNVNVFNKENWPELISFFKPRIIALDDFWYDVKDTFDSLK